MKKNNISYSDKCTKHLWKQTITKACFFKSIKSRPSFLLLTTPCQN